MHSDDSTPFRPRGEPNAPLRAMAVGFTAVCVLYAGFDWKRSAEERLQRSVEPAPVTRPVASRGTQAPSADRVVTARVEPRRAGAPARATLPAALPTPPSRTTIYRCKDYGGATFWSSAACQMQRATVDRMTTVPGHVPFEQQVAIANGAAEDAAWLYRPAAVSAGPGRIGSAQASPRRGECAVFDDSIRQIDAATRSPLPATSQDRWRAERVSLQSQRFSAHC